MSSDCVVELDAVCVVRDGATVLDSASLAICRDEHWVVMGPNGSGKSTLADVIGLSLHPSAGGVTIFGSPLGSSDLRPLRPHIGVAGRHLLGRLRPSLGVLDVVMCGLTGHLEPWWHQYSSADRALGSESLQRLNIAHLELKALCELSEGEVQAVLLARALVGSPGLLILDEPAASLDFPNRRFLLGLLEMLPNSHPGLASVTITHRYEEIPRSCTHVCYLRAGRVVADGLARSVLGSSAASELATMVFGVDLKVLDMGNGRWASVLS